ncbi:MAG: hint module-domain-containing protein [Monoraphidium minutum]|nr:MAG: hint module-domain-containing protein [Monoraphidium minutum]
MMRGLRAALFVALVLGAHAAAAGSAGAKATPTECIQRLSDAASKCSSCLNRANKVAYQRLDRLFGARSNIRLDVGRFFHLAVGFSQDTVHAPGSCCEAAAQVFSAQFQADCACLPEVVEHTKHFDKELFDYYHEFLSASCPLEGSQAWQSCGLANNMFITKVTEAALPIPAWVEAGIGSVAGVAASMPIVGKRRMQEGAPPADGAPVPPADGAPVPPADGAPVPAPAPEAGGDVASGEGTCSAGTGVRVALNNASAPFYFLCPAGRGYCDAGKCVYGRTAPAPRGEWAVCQPLTGCDDGAAGAGAAADDGSGCFPAAATVRVAPGGDRRRMDELRIGDRVLAAGPGGALEYQDVYFFGHRDGAAAASFVRLELEGGSSALELTPDHFVPVLPAGGGSGALGAARMTYARDVAPGDVLLIADGAGGLRPAAVSGAGAVRRRGLFNPYTLGGSVLVDGVLASAHSSWLVDGPAAALGASHAVPALLQALFAPLRALYWAAGPEAMEAVGGALAAAGLRLQAALVGSSSSSAPPPPQRPPRRRC